MLLRLLGLFLALALGFVAIAFGTLFHRRAASVGEDHPVLKAWVEGHEPRQLTPP